MIITLKAAISLDGKLALPDGRSHWISGEASRQHAHRLRAAHDAILVGRGTVQADDPQLNVRLPSPQDASAQDVSAQGVASGVPPARIVLDSAARSDPQARWTNPKDGALRVLIVGESAKTERLAAWKARGVRVYRAPMRRPSCAWVRQRLAKEGLGRLLVEGGAQIHASWIAAGLADRLCLYLAGKLIGGQEPLNWCAALGVTSLDDAPRVRFEKTEALGEDLCITGSWRRQTSPTEERIGQEAQADRRPASAGSRRESS